MLLPLGEGDLLLLYLLSEQEKYPSTSSSREPDKVQAPKKISLSKIKDKTGNIKEHALD
jgi:hypothetical protein